MAHSHEDGGSLEDAWADAIAALIREKGGSAAAMPSGSGASAGRAQASLGAFVRIRPEFT